MISREGRGTTKDIADLWILPCALKPYVTTITDDTVVEADIGLEVANVVQLPHLVEALLGFYLALTILLAYCACKPSCRVCLHRHACPMRRRGFAQLLLKPICTTAKRRRTVSSPALYLPDLPRLG